MGLNIYLNIIAFISTAIAFIYLWLEAGKLNKHKETNEAKISRWNIGTITTLIAAATYIVHVAAIIISNIFPNFWYPNFF